MLIEIIANIAGQSAITAVFWFVIQIVFWLGVLFIPNRIYTYMKDLDTQLKEIKNLIEYINTKK